MSSIAPDTTIRPVQRLTRPLIHFLHIESAAGIVLLLCTAVAITLANSPAAEAYAHFWETLLTFSVGSFSLSYPLWYWVNDGLMAIFFFLVGLEIKRELVHGELQEARRVIAPAVAAIGGAVVPAAIFIALQYGQPGIDGWAIPMATDIAFVVGLLSLLGKRAPHGLKIFLLTLAIIDDIIAVLVIALVYSASLKLVWLAGALLGVGLIVAMSRLGVRTVAGYVLVGAGVWLCTLKSGIHPTIAGVVLGFLTPATPYVSIDRLTAALGSTANRLTDEEERIAATTLRATLGEVNFIARESVSPLERLEARVHPWSAFLIMPLFALANAGVPFSAESISNPISIAVMLGLVAGKPLGILLGLGLVIALGIATRPGGVRWISLLGAGSLAGIGFTMSLFVASLSLDGQLLVDAKSGVLIGSAVSAAAGFALLWFTLKPEHRSAGHA